MDRKTMLRIFGDAFLRSMVVLMAVLIVGFAAFFLIKVASDRSQLADNTVEQESTYSDDELQAMLAEENAEDTSEETTQEQVTEEVTTEEITTETPDIPSTDKKILVLNSTGIAGLAKSWMNKLQSAGFADVTTGNYSLGKETQTIIYVAEEGMGNDLSAYFNDPVIQVGSVDSGIDVSAEGVQIFIVIGSNDSSVQ